MNISKDKYKCLSVLSDKGHLGVHGTKPMVAWMNDSVSPVDGMGCSHQEMLDRLFNVKRKQMRENIMYVSEPLMKLVFLNLESMNKVLREDWIKSQCGTLLCHDGSMFCYFIERIDRNRENISEIDAIEDCGGIGVLVHVGRDGYMVSCTLAASRVDYEHDGTRRVMFDSPYLTDDVAAEFMPLLSLLAFLQYAETEKVEVYNGAKKKHDGETIVNSLGYNVKYIDSRWVREIIRTEGFKVRGHFRMQRYGEGHALRKLIYINEFQKHGYHRRAGKDNQ